MLIAASDAWVHVSEHRRAGVACRAEDPRIPLESTLQSGKCTDFSFPGLRQVSETALHTSTVLLNFLKSVLFTWNYAHTCMNSCRLKFSKERSTKKNPSDTYTLLQYILSNLTANLIERNSNAHEWVGRMNNFMKLPLKILLLLIVKNTSWFLLFAMDNQSILWHSFSSMHQSYTCHVKYMPLTRQI